MTIRLLPLTVLLRGIGRCGLTAADAGCPDKARSMKRGWCYLICQQ